MLRGDQSYQPTWVWFFSRLVDVVQPQIARPRAGASRLDGVGQVGLALVKLQKMTRYDRELGFIGLQHGALGELGQPVDRLALDVDVGFHQLLVVLFIELLQPLLVRAHGRLASIARGRQRGPLHVEELRFVGAHFSIVRRHAVHVLLPPLGDPVESGRARADAEVTHHNGKYEHEPDADPPVDGRHPLIPDEMPRARVDVRKAAAHRVEAVGALGGDGGEEKRRADERSDPDQHHDEAGEQRQRQQQRTDRTADVDEVQQFRQHAAEEVADVEKEKTEDADHRRHEERAEFRPTELERLGRLDTLAVAGDFVGGDPRDRAAEQSPDQQKRRHDQNRVKHAPAPVGRAARGRGIAAEDDVPRRRQRDVKLVRREVVRQLDRLIARQLAGERVRNRPAREDRQEDPQEPEEHLAKIERQNEPVEEVLPVALKLSHAWPPESVLAVRRVVLRAVFFLSPSAEPSEDDPPRLCSVT